MAAWRHRAADRLVACPCRHRLRRASRHQRPAAGEYERGRGRGCGDRRLGPASGACGIRRLVHLSSIRAMGETAPADRPLRAADPPEPADAYGRAKLGIEIAATNAARAAGLDLVILRPP